jgi:cyclic AMP-dependent transcription factor ATF-4
MTHGISLPSSPETNKEPPLAVNQIGHLPESFATTAQVVPFTILYPLPPRVLSSTLDHPYSLQLGGEVDIFEGDRKPNSTAYITMIPSV